jgi:hypothetical protein
LSDNEYVASAETSAGTSEKPTPSPAIAEARLASRNASDGALSV